MTYFKRKQGGFDLSVIICLTVFALLSGSVADTHAGKTTYIKFSTLAPEGSSWMKIMRLLSKNVKKETGGELAFKFYPGGVSGDEKDVIRKMRIGQLHAAGFTGVGLGEILPEVRVLDLPFLFRNDKEVKHIYEKMNDEFSALFEKKGYVLLGWVPVGWVHFYSKKEIRNIQDLKVTKAWMWEGDPLVREAYKVMDVTPHPLSITDVLMSLQTGMIDTVYASSMGALALQWSTKVKYMSQVRMSNATGAVLMTKRKFNKLTDKQKEALRRVSRKSLSALVDRIQADNIKAVEVMKKNGIKLSPMPVKEELKKFHLAGQTIRANLIGKLFSKSILDKVLSHLMEIR